MPSQASASGGSDEARVPQQAVGDQLRGPLPALPVAAAPPGVMLQRTGQDHAGQRGLDPVGVGCPLPIGARSGYPCRRWPGSPRVSSARIGSLNARLPKKGWSRSSAVTQSLTRRADSERAAHHAASLFSAAGAK